MPLFLFLCTDEISSEFFNADRLPCRASCHFRSPFAHLTWGRHVAEGKFDKWTAMLSTETISFPGFIEFDEINQCILTYNSTSRYRTLATFFFSAPASCFCLSREVGYAPTLTGLLLRTAPTKYGRCTPMRRYFSCTTRASKR
jgi:hypothetical protein